MSNYILTSDGKLYSTPPYTDSDELCHYGVKGMKWGVRKDQPTTSRIKSPKNKKRDDNELGKTAEDVVRKANKTLGRLGKDSELSKLDAQDEQYRKKAAKELDAFDKKFREDHAKEYAEVDKAFDRAARTDKQSDWDKHAKLDNAIWDKRLAEMKQTKAYKVMMEGESYASAEDRTKALLKDMGAKDIDSGIAYLKKLGIYDLETQARNYGSDLYDWRTGERKEGYYG